MRRNNLDIIYCLFLDIYSFLFLQMQELLQAVCGGGAEEAVRVPQPAELRRAHRVRQVGAEEEGGAVPVLQIHRLPRPGHVTPRYCCQQQDCPNNPELSL